LIQCEDPPDATIGLSYQVPTLEESIARIDICPYRIEPWLYIYGTYLDQYSFQVTEECMDSGETTFPLRIWLQNRDIESTDEYGLFRITSAAMAEKIVRTLIALTPLFDRVFSGPVLSDESNPSQPEFDLFADPIYEYAVRLRVDGAHFETYPPYIDVDFEVHQKLFETGINALGYSRSSKINRLDPKTIDPLIRDLFVEVDYSLAEQYASSVEKKARTNRELRRAVESREIDR
jgi:hypothetical protein